uniref:fatty-acid-binding protein 2 n=1 Tax=Erigeron canadensis TaxID=72917 RepID=UPI001CB93F46|nr:fatty-acid-binding protein 2 [Erigeron canadensis]
MDLDEGRPNLFPLEAFSPSRYLYHMSCLVDNSPYTSRNWFKPESVCLQETYSCISKFTGTVLLWSANGSHSNVCPRRSDFSSETSHASSMKHNHPRFSIKYKRKALEIPKLFNKFSRFAVKQLLGKAKDLQFISAISLAGNLVPPLDNMKSFAVSQDNRSAVVGRSMNHSACDVEQQICRDLHYGSSNCSASEVEPITCIQFPTVSDHLFGGGNSSLNMEGQYLTSHPSSTEHDHPRSFIKYRRKALEIPELFNKFSRFAVQQLLGMAKDLQFIPAISLAGNLVPPLHNISRKSFAVSQENGNAVVGKSMNHSPCDVEQRRCGDLRHGTSTCSASAVEPRTGIEFPTILDNIFGGGNSSLNTEVLVGTGSKTMNIIKIKSLKLYAFGFYVHPYDVCNKLGSKYASIPENEVNTHHNFFADLLREDISMTVRLVVSCNGIKINTVRDAFEKSLRARLIKMNPDTDYDCLSNFSSLFKEDIPIKAGTTIKIQRTADGHLVTEIEGNRIGAVHSRDLCRAFFDMYIGDGPVSEQTKTEIGENVVDIMRRC